MFRGVLRYQKQTMNQKGIQKWERNPKTGKEIVKQSIEREIFAWLKVESMIALQNFKKERNSAKICQHTDKLLKKEKETECCGGLKTR